MESKPVVISHSINSTFESCPRRFEFSHVYNVGARAESGYAADVGTALHEAIQAWARIALVEDAGPAEKKKAEDAGLYALMEWWPWMLEMIGIEESKPSVSQRSLKKALFLFYGVIEDPWWNDWELAVDSNGMACIEVPWRIIHKSLPTFIDHRGVERHFITQGKIDFVLKHRKTGQFRVVDIKTTNKSAASLDASWRFSGQGPGYAMVLSAVLGLPWREMGLTVTYLACVFGTIDEPQREPIPLTYTLSAAEIDDKLREDADRLERMIKYGKQGWWPRRAGSCEMFGQVCAFFSVCHRRDSKFIDAWLAFSAEYQVSERIYETIWELEA